MPSPTSINDNSGRGGGGAEVLNFATTLPPKQCSVEYYQSNTVQDQCNLSSNSSKSRGAIMTTAVAQQSTNTNNNNGVTTTK